MTPANAAIFDAWITAEILKAKAVWLHAFYKTFLPLDLYNEAAAGKLDKPRAYAKEQGFSIHEYTSAHGGETQIHKADLIVAKFKPVLTPFEDRVQLSFEATVLGKQVPVADLTRHLKN